MDIAGEGALAINENAGEQRSNINISDVFEAISIADPAYAAGVVRTGPPGVAAATGTATAGTATATAAAAATAAAVIGVAEDAMYRAPPEHRPYVRIVEQPAAKALRFRYECEGRSAGSIPGANSTQENKTYPTIEIVGHKGRAVVVVSCVTKDEPYRPHPHNLVGRDLCKKGVCTVEVNSDNMQVSFSNLGIQCVKKKDIEEALRVREEMRVDPFKTGFKHKKEPSSIDLNAVRLCFQVFLEQGGKIRHALPPVVSDIIYDKKAMSDLVICRLSHCSAPVTGGQQVILLCEKVTKEDVAVTFFEKLGEQVTWQADADNVNVHKQVAICFNTPRYHNDRVEHDVQAYIQLRRPSDNAVSEPVPFEFIRASAADPHYLKRKRQKPLTDLSQFAQPMSEQERNQPIPDYYKDFMNMSRDQKPIKLEPKDKTPPHQMNSPPLSNMMMYRNILGSPSPQHNLAAPSPPLYTHDQYANWNIPMEVMHGANNLAVPGPSHIGGPYSPQDMSVNWQQNMGHVSPNMGQVSPNMGHVSPNLGQMSPNMGHVSPNVIQMTNAPMVPTSSSMSQLVASAMMDTQIPEGWPEPGEGMNLTELSGLSGLLDAAAPDQLSDNLSRLNTGDLLPARNPL